MEEKKGYSIKEVASILGCSITAVQKKITNDENNPDLKRYKKRYDVVIRDGKTVILLSDEELEEEKRLSKGFNNVKSNVYETYENVIDVEPEPVNQTNQEFVIDKILDFTNGYMQRYETLQKTYYDELQKKDQQIYMLTVSENNKENETLAKDAKIKEFEAKSKELSKKNKVLTGCIIVLITLLITLCAGFITFYLMNNNVTEPLYYEGAIQAEINK